MTNIRSIRVVTRASINRGAQTRRAPANTNRGILPSLEIQAALAAAAGRRLLAGLQRLMTYRSRLRVERDRAMEVCLRIAMTMQQDPLDLEALPAAVWVCHAELEAMRHERELVTSLVDQWTTEAATLVGKSATDRAYGQACRDHAAAILTALTDG